MCKYNTKIGTFCAEHASWRELLTQEPYKLKISEDGPYIMFKYDQLSSDFTNPIVQEARGIIFNKDVWSHPVCWAFNKFGNYGESYVPEIDWSTAFVTEKIDGSLIKLWWDWSGGWHVSTNGTIDAEKAEIANVKVANFRDYFELALKKYYNSFNDFVEDLQVDLTYMFELVGPYNRVVIPYDEPELYFLGARNSITGEEFLPLAEDMYSLGVSKFKKPAIYSLTTVEDCIKAAELKSWDDEGFVVCDAQFNRVKIKSPAYVMAHFARNNNVITRKHLIRVILMNEIEEFCCYASDYKEELQAVKNLMDAYHKIGDQIAKSCQRLYDVPRRTYAAWVQTIPKIYQDLAFRNYNDIKSARDCTANWNENKWEIYLEELEKLKNEYFKEL